MAACEICWERAQQDALLRGGSVVDHYERRLREVDDAITAEMQVLPEDQRQPLGTSPIEHAVRTLEK